MIISHVYHQLEFRCSWHKSIPRIGKLYISTKHLAFRSNIVGVNLKVLIPIEKIQEINHENYTGLFYNGVCIRTKDQTEVNTCHMDL
jgi:hypothetical protein